MAAVDVLAAPAWIVALASAAFFGAKAVLLVRSQSNGNGRGRFEGQVVTLLENQGREITQLRSIAADTKAILELQIELLRNHDARATAAIARLESRP